MLELSMHRTAAYSCCHLHGYYYCWAWLRNIKTWRFNSWFSQDLHYVSHGGAAAAMISCQQRHVSLACCRNESWAQKWLSHVSELQMTLNTAGSEPHLHYPAASHPVFWLIQHHKLMCLKCFQKPSSDAFNNSIQLFLHQPAIVADI